MGLEWVKLTVQSVKAAAINNRANDVSHALLLTMYCAEKENGGVIKDCAGWNRTQWRANVGCGAIQQGRNAAGLWHWEGNDLVVEWYDVAAEQQAQGTREKRRLAAELRWNNRTKTKQNAVSRNDIKHSKLNKTSNASCNASCIAEENRIENKEINKDSESDKVLLGIDSPEIRAEFDDMRAIVAGRLAK